jgi:hypothetical protein
VLCRRTFHPSRGNLEALPRRGSTRPPLRVGFLVPDVHEEYDLFSPLTVRAFPTRASTFPWADPAPQDLLCGFCASARIPPCGTPRFLQTPPHDDPALRDFANPSSRKAGLGRGLSPPSCRTCAVHRAAQTLFFHIGAFSLTAARMKPIRRARKRLPNSDVRS